jgi:hypothetical protein
MQDKLQKDQNAFKDIASEFLAFYTTYDDSEDFNSNQAQLSFYRKWFESLNNQIIQKKDSFFKRPPIQPSEFVSVQSDINNILNMGKLKDNSLNKTPSIIFDANKFAVYEHSMSK